MPASGIMTTFETNSAALPTRKLIQFHIEPTPSGVKIAIAG